MPRTINIAAVQMDATPAPTRDRLDRAAKLVKEAAEAGAQLVVLPEFFNAGYQYTDDNYALAETLDGPTATFMKQQAADHNIHLTGSFMLQDADHVYNSALLFAPDGRMWRYDKHYPFLWERAYFREGNKITIAETDLGNFGMMICWDSAHPDLWERYAGKVDAMIIPSCPPDLHKATLTFPDGNQAGSWVESGHFAGEDIDDHAAWMRVPVVHSAGSGYFKSPMPAPLISVASYVANRPELWENLQDAHAATLEADYGHYTKIVNAMGEVVAHFQEDGDGFTMAAVELADERPQPGYDQPAMRSTGIVYFFADVFGPSVMTLLYRRGWRRQLGANMAPIDSRTRIWAGVVAAAVFLGWLVGRVSGRKR